MNAVLGHTVPDPYALMFNTGFQRFSAKNGLCGLCREIGDRLEILAVDAHPLGKGQFRGFIADCKRQYKSILIMEVWNPWLPSVLGRYGFKLWSGLREMEWLEGMLWEKKNEQSQ